MALRRIRTALGVDIGSSCLKGVVMALREGSPAVLHCHSLALREQGILNESDLYAAVADWLRRSGSVGLPTAVALPQFLSTTQLIDFPVSAGDAGLAEMVAFETRQLAGLSDEAFVHDYHVLPPGSGRRNPVLIGICRESVVRERMAALQQAGIAVPQLAMSGLAAVNCLLHLQREALSSADPVLLVDIGRENSTAVILEAGQPLFVTSLLFGSGKLVQAVAEREQLEEKAAEGKLTAIDLLEASPRSPLVQAVRKLLSEMEEAVEHWRAQEREELNARPLAGVWLCGGAARLKGLAAYLSEGVRCPVNAFGPPDPQSGRALPEMAVACGLALQALGQAAVTIDLTPVDIRERAHHERRLPVLVAACALATALVAGAMVRSCVAARTEAAAIGAQMVELEACEKLIPRLDEARRGIDRYEAGVVPLVQAGSRGRRFVEALDAIAAVCGDQDWFVYLGDESSYHRGAAGAPEGRAGPPAPAPFPAGEAPRAVVGATVVTPEFPVRILARQAGGMPSLIAAGYTPFQRDQRYESRRQMIESLSARGPYGKVELLLEVERVGRKDIFDPWVQYLASQPGARFEPFSLRLALAAPDVVVPVVPEATPKR